MKRRVVSIILIVFVLAALLPGGRLDTKVYAATMNDINQPGVFLNQTESGTCTLFSVVMLIRRAAILQGDPDWNSITAADVKKVAWSDGLNADFTYKHNGISYRIKRGDLPLYTNANADNKPTLLSLLEKHPEGISIYRNSSPRHAVLLTDYTDDIFYCADPAGSNPAARIDISRAYSVTPENAKRYWYLVSPKCYLDGKVPAAEDPDQYKVPFTRTLYVKSGLMNGSDVMYMQMCLQYLGYSVDPDGWFGPASATVVKQFQNDHSTFPIDGRKKS